jgi:hypothetical protein
LAAQQVKAVIKDILTLHSSTNYHLLYARKMDGGRGFPALRSNTFGIKIALWKDYKELSVNCIEETENFGHVLAEFAAGNDMRIQRQDKMMATAATKCEE